MPDTGAPWNLTYPDDTGSVDTWLHWQALAEDVAARLTDLQDQIDDLDDLVSNAGAISEAWYSNADRTTNSTSYTSAVTAADVVGGTFVAPLSGVIEIKVSAEQFNSAGNANFTSSEIREGASIGAGTIHQGPDDDWSWKNVGTNGERATCSTQVPGLTPGATYNVRMMHKVSAGTGTFGRRELSVTPLP